MRDDRVNLHCFECSIIMEALAQVLSCPVCLELFTPPVLVLSCSHNFCEKCLENVLIRQNCNHVNGQFSCPMCRKIIHLRGRGIIGLPRNILVESILEKFMYELGNLQTKEQDDLSQICEEHGERMNLVCLADDKPICAICKLFGDHEAHTVAKLSDVYAERKEIFIKNLDLVCKLSEHTEEMRKEIEEVINELTYSIADVKFKIEAVGASLLKVIQWLITELESKLCNDYSTKVEELKFMANELQVPKDLYHQMITLLEQHSNSVHFLQEEKILRGKIEKLLQGNSLQQHVKDYHISAGEYFKDLINGIHINDYISSNSDEILASSNDAPDNCGSSNVSFCQKVLDIFQKSNKVNQDTTQNISCSHTNNHT